MTVAHLTLPVFMMRCRVKCVQDMETVDAVTVCAMKDIMASSVRIAPLVKKKDN